MRYFIDTEFIEDGQTIDLISIGIVSEDGREYYAINRQCNFRKASDWVLENVLLPMGINRQGLRYPTPTMEGFHGLDRLYVDKADPFIMPKAQIKQDILNFCLWRSTGFVPFDSYSQKNITAENLIPEFWGYYSSYDWVAFCQIFGKMIDLPTGFPMYCRDIKQLCDDKGNPQLPKTENEHNALADARWNKKAYEFLMSL